MISNQVDQIRDCLRKELPGPRAHALMAPSLRPPGLTGFDGSNPRSSGVMILLFPTDQTMSTVFILRASGGPHGGQISLPGGRQENADTDLIATARRETFEEIGVDPLTITGVGILTPLYVPHSNYIIQPVVGLVGYQPVFVPDKKEVAATIVVPLKQLFDPGNRRTMILNSSSGAQISAPYYEASGHRIWGATAMIMSEFESLITSCISG